ncbi:ATP-binding response regulator [Halonotius roseus]|uniref:histidine kinase n=1 Tax=Halonotius roseus TaxID=2511997 RepID=A0A544QPN7_9EURY|nr:hybrid sensor histidine kinase/response regulator [Halonotius roseus]TQQ81412.1 hybrid sensor histidine kinase/response regulator [Halonotius roseus]
MSISVTDELNVLLIEDNPGDATLFEHHLSADGTEGFPPATVTHCEALDAGIDELAGDAYDIVLLDLGLPESTGLATLDQYNEAVDDREDLPSVPVIVLTGLKDEAAAVEAIERGAQDYLVKDDVDSGLLHRAIRYALERHRQQQELRRQNERLERFAHVVSHDLRNPLGVAQGRVELIDDEEHAPIVADNLDRMEAIIDDVLTLAREGQAVEQTEPVKLDVLAANCWANVETADAELSVADGVVIHADGGRLQQLLENLLRNSIEHVGDDVAITIGALPDGFFVADDGPGIDPDNRDEIFEAGYTTNPDGTGFGLNIVKEIAAAHGWDVAIADSEDGGARFEFTGVRLEA